MAVPERHRIFSRGLVSASFNSQHISLRPYTRGILYASGNTSVVKLQASPDESTTWYDVYDENNTLFQRTLGASPSAFMINMLPRYVRVAVSVANATIFLEGIREIA